ncbi:MAG: TRAP transporter permease [Deltaproteobacteria bacterium]|nr:TRAP transporter permease [Deltaproteobacteria bacterium]
MSRTLIAVLAVAWSLFQLSLGGVLTITSLHTRTIHLAFAMALIFLIKPNFKSTTEEMAEAIAPPLSFKGIILAILGIFSALYLSFDYVGISGRAGVPILPDIIMGLLLIVLLLEATRRSLGPALPIVALVFIAYSFLGPYMPSVLAFKGVSLERFLSQITMTTEGIFGVPLDVSANIVFLFVLFGAFLEKAGGGTYFVDLSFSLLGRFRGGPGKAAVLASAATGMISGSSIANTVTTGTFTIPLMKKVGYPAHKAAAVEVAASTNGQLTPPIMGAAAFIIAEYTNLAYSEVIIAAFIPAIVSYIGLLTITHLEALKLDLKPLPKAELPPFWQTFKGGIHFFIPLVLLIFELMVLRHSPQLAAFRAILIIIALIIIRPFLITHFLNKNQNDLATNCKEALKVIFDSLESGAKNMVGIAAATATAGIIVGVITMGLGGMITGLVEWISGGNIYLILIITAITCLILGMGLPTTANYIVMASLTAPVIVNLGAANGLVVPLIAAHLFVFYFGILADDTPPVGLAAYAAAAIAKADPIKTGLQGFAYDIRTAVLPFLFIFNTDILLIGVDSHFQAVLIFAASSLGMIAFTSLTQNQFVTKNKILGSVIMLAVVLLCLRPGFATEHFDRYLPLSPQIERSIQITDKFELILKDFDKKADQLSNLRDDLFVFANSLSDHDKATYQSLIAADSWTTEGIDQALVLLQFDQERVAQISEFVERQGTPRQFSYLLGALLFAGLFLWQRSQHKRLSAA